MKLTLDEELELELLSVGSNRVSPPRANPETLTRRDFLDKFSCDQEGEDFERQVLARANPPGWAIKAKLGQKQDGYWGKLLYELNQARASKSRPDTYIEPDEPFATPEEMDQAADRHFYPKET